MGILEEAMIHLDRGKRTAAPIHHPFVTVSYAQSLDGSIAHRPGYPLNISCHDSLILTHRLRAIHDAILVGIGSVLADDPQLTVRHASGRNPQPVILDSRLRFPSYAKLLNGSRPLPWIFTTDKAEHAREKTLKMLGAEVIRLPAGEDDRIDIRRLLDCLAQRGIRSLMVEGGAQVITSFILARAVNQFIVCVAPFFVGGTPVIHVTAGLKPERYPRLTNIYHERIGSDLVLRADASWTEP